MTVTRLTEEVVQALVCPADRQHWVVLDTLLCGLFVDIQRSGRMAYRLRYRADGRTRYLTLGNARVITLEEARHEAREALRKVRVGANPEAVLLPGAGPTVACFFTDHYLPYVKTYKRSWSTDDSMIRLHILPLLGPREMGELTGADIARVVGHMQVRDYAPATINRVLFVLGYGYRLAMRWKITGVTENPVREVRCLKEDNRIERYLTPEQVACLLVSVRNSQNPCLADIVSFLLYTGARKREVLNARWQDVDWAHQLWRIPHTKSGRIRYIPLSEGALALLSQRKAGAPSRCDWVFANPATGKPFVTVYYSWYKARKEAGMPELRLHDLRHSFASFLVNAGRSLYEVQILLGHANARTTSRYAHLSPERLREAVAVIPSLS
ncbi:site-specific integrase [Halomonas meridiana]|uniref:site-specific integrase n=1 Tax=Vreelandella aquamarina TaxID=77097 RepID=UPI001E5FDA6A|nr:MULTISPECIES: site-specific integrase [Halomonas]MCD1652495.1 site-specific integrase [Halomonas axialensis]MCD2089178.1 site-specific integrase [Halomonas meridiana]